MRYADRYGLYRLSKLDAFNLDLLQKLKQGLKAIAVQRIVLHFDPLVVEGCGNAFLLLSASPLQIVSTDCLTFYLVLGTDLRFEKLNYRAKREVQSQLSKAN